MGPHRFNGLLLFTRLHLYFTVFRFVFIHHLGVADEEVQQRQRAACVGSALHVEDPRWPLSGQLLQLRPGKA